MAKLASMEPQAIVPPFPMGNGGVFPAAAPPLQFRSGLDDDRHASRVAGLAVRRVDGACLAERGGMPLVTIITAVLNGARHLEQCIESVASQTYPFIEFIVIDGGSTDGSLDIIERHAAVIDHWVSEPDQGIYDALNKGLRASSGDWICVLGSDDYVGADDVIEKLSAVLAQCDPAIQLVYGNVTMVDGNRPLCTVGRPWSESKPRLRESTAIPYTGLMHRRSWFERYGLYDTSFRIAGDYEMLLRGWPREDAQHVPGLRTFAMRIRGISNASATAFASLREVDKAHAMHDIVPPRWSRLKIRVHTVLRFVLQKAWNENAMWKLKRLRNWFRRRDRAA